jgi:hypothetical protein
MRLAAGRALRFLPAGAYALLDLPRGALGGQPRAAAEKEWI